MKICLCGSTRFMDQYQAANRALTLAGHVVYTVAAVSTGNHSDLTYDEKLALDAVHLRKIHESDAIMVVGRQEDGSTYIGESTRREMMYASIWGKAVYFFRPGEEVGGPFQDFTGSMKEAAETEAERSEAQSRHAALRNETLEAMGLIGHTETLGCPSCNKSPAN